MYCLTRNGVIACRPSPGSLPLDRLGKQRDEQIVRQRQDAAWLLTGEVLAVQGQILQCPARHPGEAGAAVHAPCRQLPALVFGQPHEVSREPEHPHLEGGVEVQLERPMGLEDGALGRVQE
jgi:hypothetical protein